MTARQDVLAQRLVNRFAEVPGVISATLVGSFAELPGGAGASDVDLVLVCDVLRHELFKRCLAVARELSGDDLGRPGCTVRINSTFGPLKFDDAGAVVLHLMIYDVAGHRAHVLASPFTCLDWERANFFAGRRLADVYPVLCLQPRDFTAARRGLDDYVRDLSNGGISFRRYEWDGDGSPRQVTDRAPLDERHAGEYAYHIIRNLIRNYGKLVSGANAVLGDDELDTFVARHIPSAAPLLPEFRELRAQKASGERRFGSGATSLAVRFVNAFSADLHATWESGVRRVWWIRHARTGRNDGTFFGQGRDAEPSAGYLEAAPRLEVPVVYSSPARRTIATARRVAPDARLIEDPRLLEQNYGAAEGMTVRDLAASYPAMSTAWKRGEDPAFPQGESSRDVRIRLGAFIQDLTATRAGDVAIITHNVVMREFLGQMLGVPPAHRYRLAIPHLQQFETIQHDAKVYPQLTVEQKAALTDSLVSE